MAVPYVLLTILVVEVTSKSTESSLECCMDELEANNTCPVNNQCSPGCYRRWNEDGSSSCIKCKNETIPFVPVYNLTDCKNSKSSNITYTITPTLENIGGPEVAASLIAGTFFISLLLIFSVASFFYLKRANKLRNLFYRRNKGKIRKPRYVRRERSLVMSATAAMLPSETRVSNV
uniref:Chromosome 1 open reading frame 159 n=1 Tax=Sphenodon punctatus TaxID=8508 RepID=A0A8D0HTL8_SPHPU